MFQLIHLSVSGLHPLWSKKKVTLTILYVEGVGGESQRGAAVVTLEAAAMEELALCTQSLHHVHALSTEEAHIAAADVDWELFSEGALMEDKALVSFYSEMSSSKEEGFNTSNTYVTMSTSSLNYQANYILIPLIQDSMVIDQ